MQKIYDTYYLDYQKWNLKIAKKIAKKELLSLTLNHWRVIFSIRRFYYEFHISPSLRMLIACMRKKYRKIEFSSHYLFILFPKGPLLQASKIAGIPKSSICL